MITFPPHLEPCKQESWWELWMRWCIEHLGFVVVELELVFRQFVEGTLFALVVSFLVLGQFPSFKVARALVLEWSAEEQICVVAVLAFLRIPLVLLWNLVVKLGVLLFLFVALLLSLASKQIIVWGYHHISNAASLLFLLLIVPPILTSLFFCLFFQLFLQTLLRLISNPQILYLRPLSTIFSLIKIFVLYF